LSIKEIHDFISYAETYFLFEKDLKTRKAIERNIELDIRRSAHGLLRKRLGDGVMGRLGEMSGERRAY
jgi:hypothetical protein